MSTQICYFIINFYLKYIPGSEFLNFSIAGLSEIIAHVIIGIFFMKLGPRCALLIGYTVSLTGSVPLLLQNKFSSMDGAGGTTLIAVFVLLAKFGASMALCTCYISTPVLFPTKIAATAFGICNLVGRTFAASAPIIAELKPPFPMAIFSGLAVVSIFFALPIKPFD